MMKLIWLGMTILGIATATAQEVYTTWTQHKYVVLDTRASAMNAPVATHNIPVLVRLDSVNFSTGFAQSVGRGADIRFTKNGDLVRLPHQIESWDSAGKKAEIWVRVDSVRGNNLSSFRMHWGKTGAADSSKGSAVFDTTDGFQAVLHFAEATDSTVRDATLNAYNATPMNAGGLGNPADTTGVIGRAKSLRRVSSTESGFYALTGTASSKLNFPQNGTYTLSAWANYYENNSSHIISKDERQYSLGRRTGGTQWEIKEMAEGEGKQYIQSGAGLLNSWQYIVGVRNGTAMALYVDGVLHSDAVLADANATDRYLAGDVQIGRCADAGTVATGTAASTCNFLPGAVDEVVISSTARSASWVKISYETQKPGARAALADTMPVPLALYGQGSIASQNFSVSRTGTGLLFNLPEGTAGRLTILDLRGRAVWTAKAPVGASSLLWNGFTSSGQAANPGVYLARFTPTTGTKALETKVTLTP